jgi:hypothetical protein
VFQECPVRAKEVEVARIGASANEEEMAMDVLQPAKVLFIS